MSSVWPTMGISSYGWVTKSSIWDDTYFKMYAVDLMRHRSCVWLRFCHFYYGYTLVTVAIRFLCNTIPYYWELCHYNDVTWATLCSKVCSQADNKGTWKKRSFLTPTSPLVMMTPSNVIIFCVTGPFVRGIRRSPVDSSHKDQRRGALMFSFICAWTNGWTNNGNSGDLRRPRAHYDVIVVWFKNMIWIPGLEHHHAQIVTIPSMSSQEDAR